MPKPTQFDQALVIAAQNSDVDAVKAALSKGANVNAADAKTGYTALHWAAIQGELSLVRVLIKAGASLESQLKNAKTTPLGAAVEEKQHAVIKLLLNAGAKTDGLFGRLSWAPLHHAATEGDVKTVQLLLAAGAKPDVMNKDRRTPLMQTVSMAADLEKKSLVGVVKALLAAGASAAKAMRLAKDAAERAKAFGDPSLDFVVDLLAKR